VPDTGITRGARLLLPLIGGLLGLVLLVVATGGPDCLEYLDWSRAARQANIAEIPGDLRSPAGVPLIQWSHGPGMFFALPYLSPTRHLVSDGPLAPVRDFRFMGWLAALALWGGLLGALRRFAEDETGIVLFTAAAAFAGTHLGFYSFVHSSEILTFGCLALILYWLSVRTPLGRLDALGVGVLCGCLILIRPHLVLYLPLVLCLLTWRLSRQYLVSSPHRQMAYLGAIAAPPILALAQVLWVHRWMTGSMLRSPYSFGDGSFRSLDLFDPELLAVLFHPWHGLLVYHPLYALLFGLVVAGVFRGTRRVRLLYLALALTLLAHLWVQAAWYCWWLGMWSLGNRGLGVAAVLLVPVLARAMREARPRGRFALAAATVICSLWSLLLMVQGHTNFLRWGELFAAQAATLRHLAPLWPVVLAAALAAHGLTRGRTTERRVVAAATALLLAPVFDHLALRVGFVMGGTVEGAAVIALRLTFIALAPVAAMLDLPRTESRTGPTRGLARRVLAVVALALFVCTGALFLRLAVATERTIASGGVTGPGPVAAFQYPEVAECYHEYRGVPGFEKKKEALRRFLEQNRPE
jgi:hypothetical protein